MRALTKLEDEGPWSDTASGRANRPPHRTTLYLINDTYEHYTTSYGDSSRYFRDADGDTLTGTMASQYPGIVRVWVDQGTDARFWFSYINPGSSTVTYGVLDPYGGYVSRNVTHTVSSNWSLEVAENAAAGTRVQDQAVRGTPYGDDAFVYALTGEAATSGAFEIDSATGWISVKQGASLDYETKNSYTGKVSWTVQGQQAVANVTISLTDVEVGKPDAPTVTRTEFSTQSNPALDVAWTAPEANGLTISGYNAQYRKKVAEGETANAWTDHTITDNNNQETTKLPAATSITLPDLEAGATYEVQVRALTSEEGEGPWSDTGSGRANRPPHHASYGGVYYFYVNGPGPGGLAVGDDWVSNPIGLFFADSDGDTLTWGVSSQYPGIGDVGGFELRERPSDITFLPDEKTLRWTFEFYNPASLVLTYGAHDGYGGYTQRTFTWTGTQTETRAIAENSAAGTAVGDPVTGTPYDDGDDATDDALTYTLTGEAATSGAFVIDSATGQISVQEDANLDYETKSSYTGSVTWTVQGQTATASLTINVTDVEAGKPDAPTVTRTEFSQQSNPALDVAWTAPAANGLTITGYNAQYRKQVAEGETANAWTDYTVTDTNNQQTTQLPATTTSINLPDLEAGATYEVQVRAVTSEEGEGPWSDAGEGRANRPPNLTAWLLADYTGTWGREVAG